MPDLNKERIITTVGPLFWATIVLPGATNFDGDGMEFIITQVLSPAKAKGLLEQIDALYELNTKDIFTLKSRGWRKCNEDGKLFNPKKGDDPALFTHYAFRWHTNVLYKDGKPVVIGVYNKNDVKINMGELRIGNGSTGAISGTLKYYVKTKPKEDGISLFLENVQLLTLIEYVPEPEFGQQDGDFEGTVPVEENQPVFGNSAESAAEFPIHDSIPNNTFDKDDYQDPNQPPPMDDAYNNLTDDDIPF